eukprot:SAG11_NODE_364_length_10159_cov_8.232604_4_plen_225_part_00
MDHRDDSKCVPLELIADSLGVPPCFCGVRNAACDGLWRADFRDILPHHGVDGGAHVDGRRPPLPFLILLSAHFGLLELARDVVYLLDLLLLGVDPLLKLPNGRVQVAIVHCCTLKFLFRCDRSVDDLQRPLEPKFSFFFFKYSYSCIAAVLPRYRCTHYLALVGIPGTVAVHTTAVVDTCSVTYYSTRPVACTKFSTCVRVSVPGTAVITAVQSLTLSFFTRGC